MQTTERSCGNLKQFDSLLNIILALPLKQYQYKQILSYLMSTLDLSKHCAYGKIYKKQHNLINANGTPCFLGYDTVN